MPIENCPNCGSASTNYDETFGFHKCEDCSELWAYDKDDPDYEDCEPSFNASAHREYLAESAYEDSFE